MFPVNAQIKFYISPTGNDSNIGTKKSPLASLIGACNAIRFHKKSSKIDKAYEVIVKGRTYFMQAPLGLSFNQEAKSSPQL